MFLLFSFGGSITWETSQSAVADDPVRVRCVDSAADLSAFVLERFGIRTSFLQVKPKCARQDHRLPSAAFTIHDPSAVRFGRVSCHVESKSCNPDWVKSEYPQLTRSRMGVWDFSSGERLKRERRYGAPWWQCAKPCLKVPLSLKSSCQLHAKQ